MKTLQFTQPGGPEALTFVDRPLPDVLAGQVLIDVEFAGLNFIDVLARRGVPGYASGWPFVPGMEVSGIVVKLGADVTGVGVGDRVVSFTVNGGGLAEFVAAEAQLTTKIPASLDGAAAATIPLTWATAVGLLRQSAVGPGDNVLITSAAGGVGQALIALLPRHHVDHIVAGISSSIKADSLSANVIPLVREPDFVAKARATTAGRAFDVVLESLGGDLLTESLLAIAPGGTVVSYGAAGGQSDPGLPGIGALRANNATVSGFSILNLSRSRPERTRSLIEEVISLTEEGLVIPMPRQVEWDEAIEAHLAQSEGTSVGKTVVHVK